MDRRIAPRISPRFFHAYIIRWYARHCLIIVQCLFSNTLRASFLFVYFKAAIGASRYRYDTLRGNSYEGEVEGVGGPGGAFIVLFDSLLPLFSAFPSFPSFFFSQPTVFTLLWPKRVECAPLMTVYKRDILYTSRFYWLVVNEAILRLDLILRDHYVRCHR